MQRPTFSESWYRVAGLRPRLRATVQTYRQHFRGRQWHVLRDPANNQFFRLDDAAYHFVGLLDGRRSVEQVWDTCNEQLGDRAPTQGEAIQLLGQLWSSNLLAAELPPDATGLFERYRKRVRREVGGFFMNFLFVRIPLFDPEFLLSAWARVFGWVFSWVGLVLWLGLVGFGTAALIQNRVELVDGAQGLLTPDNLVLLYISFAIIKAVHEFGHGFACKRFGLLTGSGGEVHTIGIMLLVFMPVPYVDASSAWAFRSKWHRAIVGAAGMYVELACAAVAAIVWANTQSNTVINALAYNAIFVAGVSTILFNGNPLLRYDGYYILSDLLEIPNLAQRSRDYVYYLVKRYVYGARQAHTTAQGRSERFWLVVYCIAATIYRVIISIAIILFIADFLFFVGTILAIGAVITWVVVPLGKWMKYLATSPELFRVRPRAVAATAIFLGSIVSFVGLVPLPDRDRAQGIVESRQLQVVYMQADGFLETALPTDRAVTSDEQVQLIAASNPTLEAQLADHLAERQLLMHQYNQSRAKREMAVAQTYARRIQWIDREIVQTKQQLDALRVTPSFTGVWIAPQLESSRGGFFRRGQAVGLVVDPADLVVRITADQALGPRIERQIGLGGAVEMRVRGRPDSTFRGTIERILPAGSETLPSEALGLAAGGSMITTGDDPTRTVERFFEVIVRVDADAAANLRSGQGIVARLTGPSRPLAWQWYDDLRRLVQRRFQI